jgi:hypothetical protein
LAAVNKIIYKPCEKKQVKKVISVRASKRNLEGGTRLPGDRLRLFSKTKNS